MAYIIMLLHYATLGVIVAFQKIKRMAAEALLGARKIGGFTFWDNLYYHDGHTWALPDAKGRIRIGVDDFAARLFGTVNRVSLPSVGQTVQQGQNAVRVTCGKNSACAVSPIRGVVTRVNRRAGRDPDIVTRDPYGGGWLLQVAPAADGLDVLRRGDYAKDWLLQESDKLHRMLTADLGLTMADGGVVARGLGARLTHDQWSDVVRTFLKSEG